MFLAGVGLSMNGFGRLPIPHCEPGSYGDKCIQLALSNVRDRTLPASRVLCTVSARAYAAGSDDRAVEGWLNFNYPLW